MSNDSELFDTGKGSDFNIREVLYKYVKNWKWFLISILLSLAAAYVYIQAQIPQYNIAINILIKDNQNSADKDMFQQLNLKPSTRTIDNEVQTLKSNTLMEKVVSSLSLQTSYFIKNHISKKVVYNPGFKIELLTQNSNSFKQPWLFKLTGNQANFNGKNVALNTPVQTDAGTILITLVNNNPLSRLVNVNFNSVTDIANSYLQRLSIAPVSKDGTVLIITLQDADVTRGKDILNKLVYEYNKATIEDKNLTTANQLNFLKDRINSLSVELNSVEQNVQDYKSANGVVDMSTTATAFFGVIQGNNAELNQINIQLASLNNLDAYLKSADNGAAKLPAMQGITDPTLTSLVSQLGQAQIHKESLLRTIPETNPVIGSINDQIKALKQTIFQTLQNVRSGLALTQQELKSQSGKYESMIKTVPSKERGLVDIMRNQVIKNNLFTFLLQKREETALSLASTVSNSRTIDEAKSSGIAIKPVKTTLYLTFLLFGVFLPFSVITLMETLNVKIRKRSDIEKTTGTTILAEISDSNELDPLIVTSKPRSMIAEQIRAFRSNLQYITPEPGAKVLLFTSSVSGEGKSFVSLNLGASLATTNKKVVILELDLRKPKLNIALGIENNIGISNFLIGQNSLHDIIKPIKEQPGYAIITSGPKPPNPAELLMNGRIEILINELKKEYDYIILDAPPVGLVTDAQILASFADATFYIVRYNYTVRGQIQLIEDLRERNMFNRLNIVFNAVDNKAMAYGYGYGYGYGYYEEGGASKGYFASLFTNKKKK